MKFMEFISDNLGERYLQFLVIIGALLLVAGFLKLIITQEFELKDVLFIIIEIFFAIFIGGFFFIIKLLQQILQKLEGARTND